MDETDLIVTERIPKDSQGNLGTVSSDYLTQRRRQWLLFQEKGDNRDASWYHRKRMWYNTQNGSSHLLRTKTKSHVKDSRANEQEESEIHWHQGYIVEAPGLSPDFLFCDKTHPLFAFICCYQLEQMRIAITQVKPTERQSELGFLGLLTGIWTFLTVSFSM